MNSWTRSAGKRPRWEHLWKKSFYYSTYLLEKAEDQAYIRSSYDEDVEMQDVEDDEDDAEEIESELAGPLYSYT